MAFRSPSDGAPISPKQSSFGIPGQTKVSGDRKMETTHEICCLAAEWTRLGTSAQNLAHSASFAERPHSLLRTYLSGLSQLRWRSVVLSESCSTVPQLLSWLSRRSSYYTYILVLLYLYTKKNKFKLVSLLNKKKHLCVLSFLLLCAANLNYY